MFRLIKWAGALFIGLAISLALFIPAPLQEPADIGTPPNPAKSAWFLLWMQELVSYSKYTIYLVLLLAVWLAALPYLPGSPPCERARWFQRDQLAVSVVMVIFVLAIAALTLVAMFFRGKNWELLLRF